MIDTSNNSASAQGVNVVTLALEDFRTLVDSSYPTIFSREDVQRLIDDIQEKLVIGLKGISSNGESMNTDVLDNLKSKLKERLERVIDSHDYDDNAEFELSGRSVILDFSSGNLNEEVMEGIDEVWDEIVVSNEE